MRGGTAEGPRLVEVKRDQVDVREEIGDGCSLDLRRHERCDAGGGHWGGGQERRARRERDLREGGDDERSRLERVERRARLTRSDLVRRRAGGREIAPVATGVDEAHREERRCPGDERDPV